MQRIGRVAFIGLIALALSACDVVSGLLPPELGGDGISGRAFCGEYQIMATDEGGVTPEALERTRTIIEDRLVTYGTARPTVVTRGQDRVFVELPNATDGAGVRRLIAARGVVEFVPVPVEYLGEVLEGARLPEGMADTRALFTGSEIADAAISEDDVVVGVVVNLELKEAGARLLDEHAGAHFGEQLAIVLDEIVQSAPSINARRFGGQLQISGGFTTEAAGVLVAVLGSGSLPTSVREVRFGTCP